ncbi:S8 family serine peptidase [uncultured Mucilaginibacter sp.]|uniref:S8 family serine peptidase n=1 Tax=uncultured Mucilaginibacter sp. TaxID=797541 RepID=UPI0025D11AAB|nr:S8 family serine peptidase [uncultured Mucilaginibacter sp.]
MAKNPHIQLNTSRQFDKPVKLQFNYGRIDNDDDDREQGSDYRRMALRFQNNLDQLLLDQQAKADLWNPDLNVPDHIDHIEIEFHGQFNVSKFFQPWYNEFGLEATNFFDYNHKGLFAVVNRAKFKDFVRNIERFIEKETGLNEDAQYSTNLLYLKSFQLLSGAQIIRYAQPQELMNFKLIDFPLNNRASESIFKALKTYLNNSQLNYTYQTEINQLEIRGLSGEQIAEIIQNFDIVASVTSALTTIVRPGKLNQPQRGYGFQIINGTDQYLPLIGVLDTGISALTPLKDILVADPAFNLTGSPVNEDNSSGGSGHGTAVAALAALGKKPYAQGYRGDIAADARVLSMKILDKNSGFIAQSQVLQLLKDAKAKYRNLKIFVLTICYKQPKLLNELHSTYACELDRFAHENDCLIMICTANNELAESQSGYSLGYFSKPETNLCAPADSMSNLIVGAAAGSLRGGPFCGIADSREYPALYTRRSHIDLTPFFSSKKLNKHYFRPDVLEVGGDYELHSSGRFFGQGSKASMEVLSADPTESFCEGVGTSYAAPLVANTAARIQSAYPGIRAQSIKALIVNAASLELIRFSQPNDKLLNKVCGHGLVNDEASLLSDDNSITFLIEDTVEAEKLAVFPIHFPDYLTSGKLKNKTGLLRITATLSFSFIPVLNSQMAYCPVHMAFCFFKNHSPTDILKKEEDVDSLLKTTLRWSQSGRYINKPIPNMNTQKITFSVGLDDLINEDHTFKIGVNCRLSKQLFPGSERAYQHAHPFSLAIRIEEKMPAGKNTGQLYNEMLLVNEHLNIARADGIAEADAE